MKEIKFKKNIKKVLTLKKESAILFSENQGRPTPFEIKKMKMEIKRKAKKMNIQLTKTDLRNNFAVIVSCGYCEL